jgi:hypothetical protein
MNTFEVVNFLNDLCTRINTYEHEITELKNRLSYIEHKSSVVQVQHVEPVEAVVSVTHVVQEQISVTNDVSTAKPVTIESVDWLSGQITLKSTKNYEGDGVEALRIVYIENGTYNAFGCPVACNGIVTTDFKSGLFFGQPAGTKYQIHATRFGWDPVSESTAVSDIFTKPSTQEAPHVTLLAHVVQEQISVTNNVSTAKPVTIESVDWSSGQITLKSTKNYEGDGVEALRIAYIENGNYNAFGCPVACNGTVTTDFKSGLFFGQPAGTKYQIHATRFGWDPVSESTAVSDIFVKA